MSLAPIPSWYHSDGGKMVAFDAWNIGKINAGEDSETQTIYLWNNINGKDPSKSSGYTSLTDDTEKAKYLANNTVADMQDVQITTYSDDEACDVVTDKWIRVKLDSIAKDEEGSDKTPEDSFTQIGGSDTHTLSATGVQEGIIKGTFNSGAETDTSNFSKFEIFCHVPDNAKAGPRSLYTRIIYYYT